MINIHFLQASLSGTIMYTKPKIKIRKYDFARILGCYKEFYVNGPEYVGQNSI